VTAQAEVPLGAGDVSLLPLRDNPPHERQHLRNTIHRHQLW
jgi:hypothetical protein